MIFSPDYPTLTPMTLCDQNRGGWYIVSGSQVTLNQQVNGACYQYTHDDQLGNNKMTISKIKASISEPPKYTPLPPLRLPAQSNILVPPPEVKCNVKACCNIVNDYLNKKPKAWDYDTSQFGECIACPQTKYPEIPSICNTNASSGDKRGKAIGNFLKSLFKKKRD